MTSKSHLADYQKSQKAASKFVLSNRGYLKDENSLSVLRVYLSFERQN
jgi:hypothetical protein